MPIISIDSLVININEKMIVMFWRIIFEKEEKVEKLSYVHSKETLKRLKPIRYYSNSEISKFVLNLKRISSFSRNSVFCRKG